MPQVLARQPATQGRGSAPASAARKPLPNAPTRCSPRRARATRTARTPRSRPRCAGPQRAAGPSVGADPGADGRHRAHASRPARGAQAQRDLDAYRKQLEAQDNAQIDSRAADARGPRRPHVPRESRRAQRQGIGALAACWRTPTRRRGSSLRTRLSSLALDDAARDDANKHARRARPQGSRRGRRAAQSGRQTLAALQDAAARRHPKRYAHAGRPDPRSARCSAFTSASEQLRRQFAPATGPLIATSPQRRADGRIRTCRRRCASASGSSTPTIRKPSRTTPKRRSPTSTRPAPMLNQRYALLTGTDAAAAQSAQLEIRSLEKKRARPLPADGRPDQP